MRRIYQCQPTFKGTNGSMFIYSQTKLPFERDSERLSLEPHLSTMSKLKLGTFMI